ncbi:MAG: hypothetical protein ACI9QD_000866 [Thermoproteota archaeon]|jgi:hypothetical protein
MENVVQLFSTKRQEKIMMSFDDAENLIGLITTISRKTKLAITVLNSQADEFRGQTIQSGELQNDVNSELQKWSEKMNKLGVTPVAMYKVRFDTVEGIFYWEFPGFKLFRQV